MSTFKRREPGNCGEIRLKWVKGVGINQKQGDKASVVRELACYFELERKVPYQEEFSWTE